MLKGSGKTQDEEIQLTPSKSSGTFAESGQASVARGATLDRALNIICCVFRLRRSIGVDCGVCANPALGYIYDVEPSRTE
jgi:hypothetical protein